MRAGRSSSRCESARSAARIAPVCKRYLLSASRTTCARGRANRRPLSPPPECWGGLGALPDPTPCRPGSSGTGHPPRPADTTRTPRRPAPLPPNRGRAAVASDLPDHGDRARQRTTGSLARTGRAFRHLSGRWIYPRAAPGPRRRQRRLALRMESRARRGARQSAQNDQAANVRPGRLHALTSSRPHPERARALISSAQCAPNARKSQDLGRTTPADKPQAKQRPPRAGGRSRRRRSRARAGCSRCAGRRWGWDPCAARCRGW